MVACALVEERVGLVFSWDPRTRVWVKERGPDDGMPPPVPPIDMGAVQTYFLDPANGKWHGTILGLKARQISVELKDLYRAPAVPGLALPRTNEPAEREPRRSRAPLLAALVFLVLLIGGGAYAAQAMLGTPAAVASPTVAPAASAAPSAAPSATTSVEPTAAPTAAGGGTSGGAPVRTPAPTAPPAPQTIRLSVRLPNGTQVFYSGPGAVLQGASFQAIFSVVLPTGQGGNENLTVYLGDPNTPGANASALASRPDPNGNYVLTLRAAVPKGDQRLAVIYGTVAGIHALGSISVR